jgi:hypothetical protein
MLRQLFKRKPSALDNAIARVLLEMETHYPGTEDHLKLTDSLERLMKMKQEERRSRISPDTLAIVGGNLLGILIIVAYEQKHVMTSRGLGFVMRTNTPNI